MSSTARAREELNRINAVREGAPVVEVISGETANDYNLRRLRTIYLKKSLLVHPDKNEDALCDICTVCMQKLATAYEVAKAYTIRHGTVDGREDMNLLIPVTLLFNIEPEEDESFDVAPDPYGDYYDDVFNSFFPDGTEEGGHSRGRESRTEGSYGCEEEGDVIDLDADDYDVNGCDGGSTGEACNLNDDTEEVSEDIPVRDGGSAGEAGNVNDDNLEVSEDTAVREQDHGGDEKGSNVLPDTNTERDAQDENEGRANAEKRRRRREANRKYWRRSMERARISLEAERRAAESWKPAAVKKVEPEVGVQFSARWMCEEYCRRFTASLGIQDGIKLHQTIERLSMTCKRKECHSTLRFQRQNASGKWKLLSFIPHENECMGTETCTSNDRTSTTKYCTPAYTARQVARLVVPELKNNPKLSTATIAAIVRAKGIYARQPSPRHYRAIRQIVMSLREKQREVDMASLSGFAQLLTEKGHTVSVMDCSASDMKEIRIKAAQHIFKQLQKMGCVPAKEKFNRDVVEQGDIADGKRYYSGLLFVPSTSAHFCSFGRLTTTADAAHCQGIGPQSYGTTFEVVGYDANNNLVPLLFYHYIGTESEESWRVVFTALKAISGFDRAGRVTIVDQEKSIDSAFRGVMEHAHLFLDALHVKKNMTPSLGAEKAHATSLYQRALVAPTMQEVDRIKGLYGPRQRSYLSKFQNRELYRAYSSLQDMVVTSQGAESQMYVSVRNCIRSVEPQHMLKNVVEEYRNGFLKRKAAALSATGPVPPRIEQHISDLISRGREYQSSVTFVEGTNQQEALVTSRTDATKTRRVFFSSDDHTPPSCCAYSLVRDGFPCLHGVAVICERLGSVNVHKHVERRNLTFTWKQQYEGVPFLLPHQFDMDRIMLEAEELVASGHHLHIPVALPPPRGRPVKRAGKRMRSWYEKGPKKSKRQYTCSLCHICGHTAKSCELRQLFDDDGDVNRTASQSQAASTQPGCDFPTQNSTASPSQQ